MCHPSHSLHNSGMKDYEVLGEGFKFFFFEQEMIGFAVEEIQPTFLSHGTSPWLIVGQLSASTKFRDCSRSSKMKGVMGLESWVFLISFDLEWAGIVSQCRSKPLLLSPISTYVCMCWIILIVSFIVLIILFIVASLVHVQTSNVSFFGWKFSFQYNILLMQSELHAELGYTGQGLFPLKPLVTNVWICWIIWSCPS